MLCINMGPPLQWYASAGRVGFWNFVGKLYTWCELMWCHDVKAEATTVFRLDPTSILDAYKVFWHLDMLFIGILGHPCSDTPLQVGLDFGILWVDCWPGVSRCDVIMSKLRLQQSSDCWIPHTYWMYTKCFGTLICYLQANWATLAVVRLCRLGLDFGILWVDCVYLWAHVMSWCQSWGYNSLQTESHIHIGCIQSVLAPWYAVYAYGATLAVIPCLCRLGVDFGILWG
jgi:hypothetical protein